MEKLEKTCFWKKIADNNPKIRAYCQCLNCDGNKECHTENSNKYQENNKLVEANSRQY